MKKLFGGIDLTWPKLIIFAVLAGVYAAIMALLPITQDTSFADITVTLEVWILFGIIIIMNSKSPIDSALKCFVFFLISQPLVYLIQVPFNGLGWGLFVYYKYWFIWTILTFPMGFVGYFMKKDKWWGILILAPMIAILGLMFGRYFGEMRLSFPHHLLTTIYCVAALIILPVAIFTDKKARTIGIVIGIVMILGFSGYSLLYRTEYNTDILISSDEPDGFKFDNTYKVYLEDEKYGELSIEYNEQLDDYLVHAKFIKTGKTGFVVESPDGEKTEFDIVIERDTYDVNKR